MDTFHTWTLENKMPNSLTNSKRSFLVVYGCTTTKKQKKTIVCAVKDWEYSTHIQYTYSKNSVYRSVLFDMCTCVDLHKLGQHVLS